MRLQPSSALRFVAFTTAVVLLSTAAAVAQPVRAPLVPLHRMDYRALGYRFFNEVPGDAAFITALATGGDGRIYGATSGVQSYLFAFSDATNQVKPLGTIADAEGVHHSLVIGRDGAVYIGGGRNVLQAFPIRPDLSMGRNHISIDLWTQVLEQYAGYPGGHLYRYDPAQEPRMSRPGQAAGLKDMGVPVPGDGIYCMAIDAARDMIYGISYPRAHFFVCELATGRLTDKGPMFKDVLFGGPDNRTLRTLPRALIVTGSGEAYTSTDGGRMLKYDPAVAKLQVMAATIPGEDMPVVDALVRAGDVVYGGTSEGYLFQFSPASGVVEDLGKLMRSQRVRGLTLGQNGKLYGIAGGRSGPNLLFSYDTEHRHFIKLGGVAVDRSPFYSWQAQQFDAMTTGADGTIYMGESDRGGRLFLYIP